MMAERVCLFTEGKAQQEEYPQLEGLTKITSDACGIYWITEQALRMLETRKGENPKVDQGLINCARRCLEVQKDYRRTWPLWTMREEASNYDANALLNPSSKDPYQVVVCSLEDYLEEPVDHSIKPMILLEKLGSGLSNHRAFGTFEITLEDRIWTRIVDKEELAVVVQYLLMDGLIRTISGTEWDLVPLNNRLSDIHSLGPHFQMTIRGWGALNQKKVFSNTNKVFIASAFSWNEGEENIRSEAIEAIKRACRTLGFEASPVSQDHTDNITDRIMAEIRRSRFVVVELTYHNRGAYYEAGFAKGLGIPVYFVVREGFTSNNPADDAISKRIHFDIAQIMYRIWKQPEDLEKVLQDWIESTIGRYGELR